MTIKRRSLLKLGIAGVAAGAAVPGYVRAAEPVTAATAQNGRLAVGGDLEMFYQTDDFTDPWARSDAVLLIHGNSESGEAWFPFVPALSRRHRTIRPDMRGFGRSTPMPENYVWSLDRLAEDFVALLDHLNETRVHVVAAKTGCLVAARLAANFPARVKTLTVCSMPSSGGNVADSAPSIDLVRQGGVEAWARRNMVQRLGTALPPEAGEYWAKYMGRTASSTQIGYLRALPSFDPAGDFGRIRAPMLVLSSEVTGPASAEETRKWLPKVAQAELFVFPSRTMHIALTDGDAAATKTADFIARHAG